jgi:hypothetical protein
MDAIETTYNKTVSTKRLSPVSGTNKEEYIASLGSVACLIQPDEVSYSEDVEGQFGKNFVMFCAIVDIKDGDIVVDGTDEYKVIGSERFDFMGHSHMELELRQRI